MEGGMLTRRSVVQPRRRRALCDVDRPGYLVLRPEDPNPREGVPAGWGESQGLPGNLPEGHRQAVLD